MDNHPFIDDERTHLERSVNYFNLINATFYSQLRKQYYEIKDLRLYFGFRLVDREYPPLYAILAAVNGLVFGISKLSFFITNNIFFIILIITTFLIGKKIYDKETGILSAVIISFYPMVFGLSRMCMIEIALCAMVNLGFLFLLYSERFQKLGYSLIFGLVFGLGMLTKQSYFIFLVGPVAFSLLSIFKSQSFVPKIKIAKNILFFLLCSFVVMSIWYLPNLNEILSYTMRNAFGKVASFRYPIFSLKSLFFYLFSLPHSQILPFFTIIFVSAVVILLIKKKMSYLILIWIFVSYCLLTLVKNKYFYYSLAFLPAVAIISSKGLLVISSRKLKKTLLTIVIAFAVFQYFYISFLSGYYPKVNSYTKKFYNYLNAASIRIPIPVLHDNKIYLFRPSCTILAFHKWYPGIDIYKNIRSRVLSFIYNNMPYRRVPMILTISNIDSDNIESYSQIDDGYLILESMYWQYFLNAKNVLNENRRSYFMYNPYIMGLSPSYTIPEILWKNYEDYDFLISMEREGIFLYPFSTNFSFVKKIPVDTGREIFLYKNKKLYENSQSQK